MHCVISFNVGIKSIFGVRHRFILPLFVCSVDAKRYRVPMQCDAGGYPMPWCLDMADDRLWFVSTVHVGDRLWWITTSVFFFFCFRLNIVLCLKVTAFFIAWSPFVSLTCSVRSRRQTAHCCVFSQLHAWWSSNLASVQLWTVLRIWDAFCPVRWMF